MLSLQKNILRLILISSLGILNSYAAQDSELPTCDEMQLLKLSDLGEINCNEDFHHYNANAANVFYDREVALENKNVSIGSFNVFQAGSPKTEYKDYEILAKIMNNFDVVSTVELVPLSGVFKTHNDSLMAYYNREKEELQNLLDESSEDALVRRANLKLLLEQYELPGYVKILRELRKLDKSWALILSPAAEGTDTSTVKELSGFYYRASVVRPIKNEYCDQYANKSIACYASFNKKFYGREVDDLISRRPMVGSFESGNFDFTLLSVHTVYNAPSDEELKTRILKEAFGITDINELPKTLKSDTYARFAEVKHILEFSRLLKEKFSEKDIFILGDFNLRTTDGYWSELLPETQGEKLFIEESTSIANSRFLSDGTVTNGTANNYDHFIFNPSDSRECGKSPNPKVFNFIENSVSKLIDSKYLIRSDESYTDEETKLVMYALNDKAEKVAQARVGEYTKYLEARLTVKRGELVPRYDVDEKMKDLQRKVFDPQIYERTYYRYLKEIISDHLAVYMNCSNLKDLD